MSSRRKDRILDRELGELLGQIEDWLELPMVVLAFVWLILLIVEFIWGLPPVLQVAVTVIWILFVLDFVLRFLVAPRKLVYLRNNLLTAISLAVPALRVFRLARALRLMRIARAARGLRLVRVVSTLNRGMRALRASMARRGFGYVAALTLIVLFGGSAGMLAFEHDLPGGTGFSGYGEALWWTAMLLTTVGSEYWPQTPEGRILCLLLSIYSIAILGYVAATLATFFLGREAESEASEIASARSIEALRRDIAGLQETIRRGGSPDREGM